MTTNTTSETPMTLEIPKALTVRELADLLQQPPVAVIKTLITNGIMADITKTIDYDTAAVIAVDFGFDPIEGSDIIVEPAKTPAESTNRFTGDDDDDDFEKLLPRPPVLAMLGHVDHGKTSLLDKIRQSNVQENETGGITQSIGAYQTTVNERLITFIDTPGHEAFTQMRARGAQATDIAILVVAANDGVMPQTSEAINHIRAAGIPMIVALNKIDIENANTDRTKAQLADAGVAIEEFGGDIPLVPVSASTGEGIDDLLETIILTADIQDLMANPDREASGVVLESELDRKQGPRATVLIQRGTIRLGDALIVGQTWGKIKAMFSFSGERIKSGGPSTPISILGINDVASAGDQFLVLQDDRTAKRNYEKAKRSREAAEAQLQHAASLDALFGEISQGDVKELNLVLKTDADGSIGPLRESLEQISNDEIHVKVIHAGAGTVSESDISLAVAARGIVIAFSIGIEPGAKKLADNEGIEIRSYDIIYSLINEVEAAASGMLEPVSIDVVDAHAEVLQIFSIQRVGNIAGSRNNDGTIKPELLVRVIRNSEELASGKITSLRRFQENANQIQPGQEFGVSIDGFQDFQSGDLLEFFHTEVQSRIISGGQIRTSSNE